MSHLIPPTTLHRFWSKVDKVSSPTGCWIWTGAFNTPKRLWRGQRTRRPSFKLAKNLTVYAHRLALSLADGTPLYTHQGEEACHDPSCANPKCVNPYTSAKTRSAAVTPFSAPTGW